MKKMSMLIMIFGLCLITSSLTLLRPAKAQSGNIFFDNFESYTVGTLPTPPWEFWFNNIGEIVNTTSVSGTQSLELQGAYDWSTEAIRPFTSSSPLIGYEVYAKAEAIGSQDPMMTVGFAKQTSGSTSVWYAQVSFMSDGQIHAPYGGTILQAYSANAWYDVKVLFNRQTRTYNVWINGVLEGSAITDNNSDPYAIQGFDVASEWAAVHCYFDDARVFESPSAALTLGPSSGFASTTIVGSGFSNNSIIAISWDGATIPSIPNTVTTDATGNFTALISVPTQTAPGAHIVNATDGSGNWATATFTVVNMTGPQGPKGDTGAQGPDGLQGQQGPKGDTGLQGLTGPQGLKGDKGDTGDTGPQGPAGLSGDTQLALIAFPTAASIVALCIAVVALLRKKT